VAVKCASNYLTTDLFRNFDKDEDPAFCPWKLIIGNDMMRREEGGYNDRLKDLHGSLILHCHGFHYVCIKFTVLRFLPSYDTVHLARWIRGPRVSHQSDPRSNNEPDPTQ
jgi:hypothetical protein